MPLADFIKKRRAGSVQNGVTPIKPAVMEDVPLQGFDQSRKVTPESTRVPVFCRTLDDVFKSPSILNFFMQFLDTRSASNLVQFILDVRAFQAAHTSCASKGFSAIFNNNMVNSDSVESFDSGIMSPGSDHRPGTPLTDEGSKSIQILAIGIYQR